MSFQAFENDQKLFFEKNNPDCLRNPFFFRTFAPKLVSLHFSLGNLPYLRKTTINIVQYKLTKL